MELWLGGGISGGLGSMIAGGNFVDGLRQGLISSGLNHALHGVGEDFQVDRDLVKMGLNPNGVPEFSIESVLMVEKADGIQKLLGLVSRPKISLQEGGSVYDFKSGYAKMVRNDFGSWRRLTTAYGHEIVHRYVSINFSHTLYSKYTNIPNSFNEGMAHYWSSNYSGLGVSAFNYNFNSIRKDKYLFDLFNSNRIKP